jgi:thioredoxin reductase (NADPH)
MQKFDVIIIGGGPIGLACAIEAKKNNLSYLILEKGCLVNSIYNYPTNMTFFSTSERLELNDIPFVSNSSKPTRNEALEYYRRVAIHQNISINLFEEVLGIEKSNQGQYQVHSNKSNYLAKNIILATGFYDMPQMLGVKGETLPKVKHYYNDPHLYAFQKILVVGSNNSAVDAALETYRKGADVTMLIRNKEIGQRVKYWVKPDIENRIAEGSIKAYFNSSVSEILERKVVINTPEGKRTIENDWVLAMTGYKPNLEFLKKIGINLSKDQIMKPDYNENTMETNIENVYLAGVVCGGMNTHSLFIENSRVHAQKIIEHIAKNIK